MGHNRVYTWCAYGGVIMFKAGDTIKIPEQTITLEGDDGVFDINGYVFITGCLKALGAVKVRKLYTASDLRLIYDNSDKESVLMRALEAGEFYQGWPKWDLIFMAMGYKKDSEKENTWYKVGEE